MKTAAKLTGFVMMLSFLAFIWLSHTGVMPGSSAGHFLGGLGMLILAVCGFCIICFVEEIDNNDDRLFDPLMFFYGLLLVFNAVLYVVLKTADLIGPYPPPKWDESNMVFLGIFYIVLAIAGLSVMFIITKSRN